MRARDVGLACGDLPTGPRNAISDVPGVTIGHCTLSDGDIQTGVTAIIPHPGNIFTDKLVAAADVLNGFGKSVGLMQIEELGQLETPILLTNTFGVGTCANALIRRAIAENPRIGRRTSTVNPVVGECNDGVLNDIQAMAVTEAHAFAALDAARADFASGGVGAGRGMTCFGFQGGIGTASRLIRLDGVDHVIGGLVLANFGRAGDLRLPDGRRIDPGANADPERGSIIIILATDIPLDHRQLRRVIRRAGVGLARLGSSWGHGSGDVMLGFTTANRVPHDGKSDLLAVRMLNESRIDALFGAVADLVQEAVLDALVAGEPVIGRGGRTRPGLLSYL